MRASNAVTVVIPWGSPASPALAVASALAQGPSVEAVLVLRNGAALARDLTFEPPPQEGRVRMVDVPACANANIARNMGLFLASTPFVAYLDADDSYPLGYLEAAVSGLQADGAAVSIASLKITDRKGVHFHRASREGFEGIENYLFCHRAGSSSGLVVRTDTRRTCVWSWTLRRHQDYDYLARLFACFPVVFRDDLFVATLRQGRRLGIRHLEDAFWLSLAWRQKIRGAYWRAHVRYLLKHLPFRPSWPALVLLPRLALAYAASFFTVK